MARVLMVVRILPADSEVDLEELGKKINSSTPPGIRVESISREPMAFGMESLIIGFSVPEEEGSSDMLEGFLRSFSEIGEINVEGMTRMRD